jgi:L-fuculose-phosphate aldolase
MLRRRGSCLAEDFACCVRCRGAHADQVMTPTETITQGHNKSEEQHRRELCIAGRWLSERGYIVACEGNLSVCLTDGRILATPAGFPKGRLALEDLVLLDRRGRFLEGSHPPSTELLMHLLFYRLRPDVQAVCHAHPPQATGFASAGRALDQAILPEVVVSLGKVPLAPYGTPGTEELSVTLEPFVPHYNAILMANHGAVTCGPDLLTAFFRMETVEQLARVTLVTEILGGASLLSRAEVETLIAARTRYGVALPEGAEPELPVTSDTAPSFDSRAPLTRADLEILLEEFLRRDRLRS